MSLLEKRPSRTARERAQNERTVKITRNALSPCLGCRSGLPKVLDGTAHITKDGRRLVCDDRPVARPPRGW